jgi:hypothetical protein
MKQEIRSAEAEPLQLQFRRAEAGRRKYGWMAKPVVSLALRSSHSFADNDKQTRGC